MSQFFDDLARTLAQPMPRRRALRLAGGALVAVAVPGITATKAYATHDCPAQNAFLCACPNRDLFYKICCPNPTPAARYECRCKAPPNGYAQCYKLTNRCEQAGTEQCGSACCDDETETCVNPSRSLCCKKEDAGRACLGIGTPGSAEKGSGGMCCPAARPKCCAGVKVECCEQGGECCKSKCCPPDKVCNKKTGACKCPKGTTTCGRECCTAKEVCSNGKCCPKGKVNCGGTCCDPIDCCAEKCCGGDTVCVNGTCCPPARAFGSGANARCCPAGTVAKRDGSRFRCCPPGNPDCCGEDAGEIACLPPSMCVSGTCKRL